MASSDLKNSVVEDDSIPQWKKELMVDLKTYAKTINSSGVSIKLTCPKALRPQLKKQLSKTNEINQLKINKSTISNEKSISCSDNNNILIKNQQKLLNSVSNTDDNKLNNSLIDDENLPKPGLVKNLKQKYLSLLNDNTSIEKRSTSLENILESTNPFYDKPRRKSVSLTRLEIIKEQKNENYQPNSLVISTAKQIFENNDNIIKTETNPFRYQNNKPPISPNKPKIIPKSNKFNQQRITVKQNKPPISPVKPKLSTEHFFRKMPIVKPFSTSPL